MQKHGARGSGRDGAGSLAPCFRMGPPAHSRDGAGSLAPCFRMGPPAHSRDGAGSLAPCFRMGPPAHSTTTGFFPFAASGSTVNVSPSSPTSTVTAPPRVNSPNRIASASGRRISRSIRRRIGRAPNLRS
jgi:hypothetical protein